MIHARWPLLAATLLPLVGCVGNVQGLDEAPAEPTRGGMVPGPAEPGLPAPPVPAAPKSEPDPTTLPTALPTEPARCEPGMKPASPAGLRRLTAAQWEASVRALLGKPPTDVTNPFDDGLGAGRFSTLSRD